MRLAKQLAALDFAPKGVVPFVIVALAAAYVVTGRLGLLLALHQDNVTLIWAPTGLSIAALVVWGRQVWPGVFIGALCVNVMVGTQFFVSLGIAVGNTAEAIVGAWLLTSVARLNPGFNRLRDVGQFTAYGVVLATFLSATVGVLMLYLAGSVATDAITVVWLDWWLGNAGGALVFAPLLMVAVVGRPSWTDLAQRKESWLALALTTLAVGVPFGGFLADEWQLLGVFLPFPFITWAGLRLGPRGAVLLSSLVCTIAISGTGQGLGPFTSDVGLYLTWAYMTVIGMFALILVATVSEREDAELGRQRLEAQLRHEQRLDSLGRLAGGLAHSFNNLLTPIRANAEMIRTFDVPLDERKEMLAGIEDAAAKASELSMQMLTYAGRSKPLLGTVDIVSIAKQTEALLASSHPGHVSVVREIADDIPKVAGDPTQLRQLLVNLLLNAFDAVDEHGSVVVRISVADFSQAELDGTFVRSDAVPGTFVVIEVVDDGHGMTDFAQQRAFDPFFSTRDDRQGLGLAVVQGIVRLHGGAITVDSEPNGGSRFRVLLRTAGNEASVDHDETGITATQTGRILVADDDPDVTTAAERMLVRAGFEVVVVNDGAQAIAYFTSHSTQVDLVLLDVVMLVVDGKEALMAMRKVRPDLPVVFMSGFDISALDDLQDESIAFIQKPFNWHTLISAITTSLATAAVSARG